MKSFLSSKRANGLLLLVAMLLVGCGRGAGPGAVRGNRQPTTPAFPDAALRQIATFCLAHARFIADREARFACSFTDEQRKRMAAGKWITYNELTPKQRELRFSEQMQLSGFFKAALMEVNTLAGVQTRRPIEQSLAAGEFRRSPSGGGVFTKRGPMMMDGVAWKIPQVGLIVSPPAGPPPDPPALPYPAAAVAALSKYAHDVDREKQRLRATMSEPDFWTNAQRETMAHGGVIKLSGLSPRQRRIFVQHEIMTWAAHARWVVSSMRRGNRELRNAAHNDYSTLRFRTRQCGRGVTVDCTDSRAKTYHSR